MHTHVDRGCPERIQPGHTTQGAFAAGSGPDSPRVSTTKPPWVAVTVLFIFLALGATSAPSTQNKYLLNTFTARELRRERRVKRSSRSPSDACICHRGSKNTSPMSSYRKAPHHILHRGLQAAASRSPGGSGGTSLMPTVTVSRRINRDASQRLRRGLPGNPHILWSL